MRYKAIQWREFFTSVELSDMLQGVNLWYKQGDKMTPIHRYHAAYTGGTEQHYTSWLSMHIESEVAGVIYASVDRGNSVTHIYLFIPETHPLFNYKLIQQRVLKGELAKPSSKYNDTITNFFIREADKLLASTI